MNARALLRAEATEARLSTLSPPGGGAWARASRGAALARLQAMGMPGRRDEYWRFTDPSTLVDTSPTPVAVAAAAVAEPEPFDALDAHRIVLVDGRLDAAASDPLDGAGLTVESLAGAAALDDHWAASLHGALEAAGQAPVPRPLAALCTAFAPDGIVLRATAPVKRPVLILHRREAAGADVLLHHLVRLEPGASLTLVEAGGGADRLISAMEVDLAEGSTFRHVRVQPQGETGRAATHVFARLAARADFRAFTLTLDGALTRNEAVVTLTGDDGVAHVAGAVLAEGPTRHHDDTVLVTHDGLRCESRQVFKKVLRGGAVGVFQGKILVRPGAQKTDGYQLAQALLLHEESQFLAKPELEIYADDVACSHGATVGAIDEQALFYLRSRGVPVAEARDLMTLSFLRQALDEVTDASLVGALSEILEAWMARRR